jgi:hypothetical protein
MLRTLVCYILLFFTVNTTAIADCCCDLQLPQCWQVLKPTINARLRDPEPKLKLNDAQVDALLDFMEAHQKNQVALQELQMHLPNATVEILRLMQTKKLTEPAAQKLAQDLLDQIKDKPMPAVVALDRKTALQLAKN